MSVVSWDPQPKDIALRDSHVLRDFQNIMRLTVGDDEAESEWKRNDTLILYLISISLEISIIVYVCLSVCAHVRMRIIYKDPMDHDVIF